MRKAYLLGAAILACAAAAPASAATIACSNTDISPTATSCEGFFDGNALSGNQQALATQRDALAQLGLTFDGAVTSVERIESFGENALSVDFQTLLTGTTFIGLKFGNGEGGPGNDTAFYRLDAGSGLDSIGLKYRTISTAVLYKTGAGAIPEPGSWAMMIIGFGAVGASLRRRPHVGAAPIAA